MAPDRSVSPLAITLRGSRRLLLVLGLLHLGALVCLIPLPLPWWIRGLMGAAVSANLGLLAARHALRTAGDSIVGAVRRPDGRWVLTTARGGAIEATQRPGAYVHPELVIIRFRTAGRGRRMVLIVVRDAADADAFRRLRRLLCLA